MELLLKDTENKILDVPDSIFCYPFNEGLVHQVVSAYATSSRQGTRAQKSRAEVTGSGRKPWTQKGTGRARSGSVKSPIWRSGGVTFAAHPKCYKQKVNKKMYRGAIKGILSELVRQDRLIVVENFFVESEKTKLLVRKLKNMLLKRTLIFVKELDKSLFLAARNLHEITVRNVTSVDPISLITFDKTLMTVDAVKKLEEILLA